MNIHTKRRVQTSTTITKSHTANLGSSDIIQALSKLTCMVIPDDASVTFRVPSGGDYSGEILDISAARPVIVSWTEEVKK